MKNYTIYQFNYTNIFIQKKKAPELAPRLVCFLKNVIIPELQRGIRESVDVSSFPVDPYPEDQ